MIRTISTQFGACCVITRSLLKHTDLSITEFFPFPENCASSGLPRDPSDKNKIKLNMVIFSWEFNSICAVQNLNQIIRK